MIVVMTDVNIGGSLQKSKMMIKVSAFSVSGMDKLCYFILVFR